MVYLTIEDVSKKIGVKKRTILEWIKKGEFPRPDKVKSHKTKWWFENTIDNWMKTT